MMRRLPFLAMIGILVSGFSDPAVAQDLPTPTEGRLLDLAGVLDATVEARIDRLLADTAETTGVEMEVVTLTDIADYGGAGERLDAYAARLLDAWEIGATDKNDAILILVTTATPDARIALGSAYPPVYDKRAAKVLGESMLLAFREGRIPAGIEAGVVSARDRLITPFLAGAPVTASDGFGNGRPQRPSAMPDVLLALVVTGSVGYLLLRNVRLRRTCPSCGARSVTRTFDVIEPSTARSEGSGIEHRLCTNCGYMDRQVYTLKSAFGLGYRRKLGK